MLRVIGAGLGRTGTNSLKLALERLLDAPCYHMIEVNRRPEHAQIWLDALLGRPEGLDELLAGYAATVDWPGAALWQLLRRSTRKRWCCSRYEKMQPPGCAVPEPRSCR